MLLSSREPIAKAMSISIRVKPCCELSNTLSPKPFPIDNLATRGLLEKRLVSVDEGLQGHGIRCKMIPSLPGGRDHNRLCIDKRRIGDDRHVSLELRMSSNRVIAFWRIIAYGDTGVGSLFDCFKLFLCQSRRCGQPFAER